MSILLTLLISWANAAELQPIEAPDPVVIQVGKNEDRYHLIRAGSQLDFDTPGPLEVKVDIRQRLASANQKADGELRAVGDSVHPIMTITVQGAAEGNGQINDAYGGIPSKADHAEITVPAGGSMLSLIAPSGGGDFFVRVMDEDGLEPVAAVVAPLDTEEPNEEPRHVADEKPKKKNQRTGSGGPAVGAAFGLGVPARGTKAVGYLAAEGRYPIYKNFLSAGGAIGWYRIGVNQSVQVADPYSGPSDIQGTWHTDVVPIVARILGHLPFDLGPVIPMGGLGFGMYFAKRIDGTFKSTRLGVGPEILVGSEFELGVAGRIGTHISWNGARVRYGNRGPDGEEVRETIANTRLNLRYLYLF